MSAPREFFATRLGVLATMIGVAVGIGNVWRFPYMVGRFGGAAFLGFYLLLVLLIGIPALMTEWSLGRHTRRGPLGAYQRAGVPAGRLLGGLLFLGLAFANAYYCNAVGWVLFNGIAEVSRLVGGDLDGASILPPDQGVDGGALRLQMLMTAVVVLSATVIVVRGLRQGIEPASRVLTPLLFLALLVLLVRSVTLPGAGEGLQWLFRFEPGSLTAGAAMAALGQMVFSLALGGTFMVIYGSYLPEGMALGGSAAWTVIGDTGAGLLAGLAIFPAVFALGLEPSSGPGLLFFTLPGVFSRIPGGTVVGALFFLSLGGAALMSAIAAFEVLVAGVVDNGLLSRTRASWSVAAVVFVLAIPPMLNMGVFVPWDLTFGSGFQTFGALAAAVTVGWSLDRGAALKQLATTGGAEVALLMFWVRWVIPGCILSVGVWWVLTELLGVAGAGG